MKEYDMDIKRVAFFDSKPYDREYFNRLNTEGEFKFKFFESKLTPDTAALATGYDAVCGFVNDDFSEEVIGLLEQQGVKLAAMRCAGYNNVDLKAAFGKIHVVRVPAYSPFAVAEYAVALIMSLNRKTHRAYYRVRDNNFSIAGLSGFDLNGKVAGVVGTGKIGRILMRILNGFGMEVIAYDAYPNEQAAADENFSYVELDELYRRSDLISLHCPLTPETHHLISDEAISKMKPGVMIINTGRGGLIDTRALIEGLKNRKIGSAGLDVYEEEGSWFFEDFSVAGIDDDVLARLMTFPNVLVTSHQAFFTDEALTNIAETTLSNLRTFFGGTEMINEVCYRCDKNCSKKETGRCF